MDCWLNINKSQLRCDNDLIKAPEITRVTIHIGAVLIDRLLICKQFVMQVQLLWRCNSVCQSVHSITIIFTG